jgi:hypothetical protein
MLQAPAGGAVSRVNGERYEGGEFMPEHGLYCGNGSPKVKVAELESIRSKLGENDRIEWREQFNCWTWLRKTTLSDGTVTWQIMVNYYSAKTLKKYWKV